MMYIRKWTCKLSQGKIKSELSLSWLAFHNLSAPHLLALPRKAFRFGENALPAHTYKAHASFWVACYFANLFSRYQCFITMHGMDPEEQQLPFPSDVLVVLLEKMDKTTLKTARLVCKAFRRGSITCIKSLVFNLGEHPTAHSTVVRRLKVFSFVTHLEISEDIGNVQALMTLPAVSSILCRLRVSSLPNASPIRTYLEALAPAFRAATRLTALELHISSLWFLQEARVLSDCNSLQEVSLLGGRELWNPPNVNKYDLAEAILSLPSLNTICSSFDNYLWWEPLLERAVQKTQLQSLRGVACFFEDVFQSLVLLTRLNCLELCIVRLDSYHSQLSKLSSLRVFRLLLVDSIRISSLEEVVQNMPDLRELALRTRKLYGDVARLDSTLATLPKLTGITICPFTPDCEWPASLRRGGFARVRDLSMPLVVEVPAPLQAGRSMRLEGLEELLTGRGGAGRGRVGRGGTGLCYRRATTRGLPNLPMMPYLTKFCAKATLNAPKIHVSARFLKRFPILQHLELEAPGVLALEQWNEDVKYIAALTNLTALMISHEQASSTSDIPLTFEMVRPLTTLRLLKSIKAQGPLAHAIGSREFREAMESLRHVMGLPPIICDT
jgi:hypothetical protein